MRIRALVIRILKQFFHDKRTLGLMFFAPLLILYLMSLVFNGADYHPKLGSVGLPALLVQQLEAQGATVNEYTDADLAEQALEATKLDAVLTMNGQTPQLKLEGSDPSKNKAVLLLLQKTLQALSPAAAKQQAPKVTYLHGSEDMTAFDNFGPVLIGFFAFFFVFLIAGVSFLRERTGGTLERLLATPLHRWEIVAGYVIGFGIFTMIQAGLIAWFAVDVLDIMMVGSFWYVLLITLLLSMTALTLGTLISAFANNEFQMIQFIPLVIVPQVFFSGLFSLDTMSPWLRGLGVVMPLTYGAESLRNVMIRGKGWSDIALDIGVLACFSLAFMALNVLALRKHRRI
jgi:ABC-2 type transport system permease protein